MSLKLRDYQRAAIDATYKFLSERKGNPLIVAPTASGKSLILGKMIQEIVQNYPYQRILLLAHRKELLQQNASKILQFWPEAPLGIYSAGLKSREISNITVAGIASIYNKANELKYINLIIIDECHLTPAADEGMYRTLIKSLQEINPRLRVIGLTATPYRMKSGMLTDDGGIFTDISYEIDINLLIKEGHLTPLVSKSGTTQADLSEVRTSGGEFIASQAEAALDIESLTEAAITEWEHHCGDRESWMIFAQGVDHAMHVTEALNRRGHKAECIVGETDDMFRRATINRFVRRDLKCLVNCDVLTTGFDAPCVDAIMLLRATQSTGLYVQICGRGMRLYPGKKNCIVMDHGGNIRRHGPIDHIKIQRKSGAGSGGEREVSTAPTKDCEKCQTTVVISTKLCPTCGHEFEFRGMANHSPFADTTPIMKGMGAEFDPPKKYLIKDIVFTKNDSKTAGKPPTLRVTYTVDEKTGNLSLDKQVREWVSVENRKSFARVVKWWSEMAGVSENEIEVPITVDEALSRTKELRTPVAIWVQKDGQWDRVVSREFPSAEQQEKMAESERALKEFEDSLPF